MKKEISPKLVALIFGVLVMVFAIGFYVFSWTGPTQIPPEGNVDAPINVGSTAQTKTGDLTIDPGNLTLGGAFSCSGCVGSSDVGSIGACSNICTDAVDDSVSSSEIDGVCSTDDKILKRSSGTWECADDAVNDPIASCTNVNSCTITAEDVSCLGCVTSTDIGSIGNCSNICTDAINDAIASCTNVNSCTITADDVVCLGCVTSTDVSDLDTSDVTSGRFGKDQLGWAADKLLLGAGPEANPTEIDAPDESWLLDKLVEDEALWATKATVADFQAIAATGTFGISPGRTNDNETTNDCGATAVDQYAEVDFGKTVAIKRWRWYTDAGTGDGRYKIQYYDLVSDSWQDWVTNIPTGTAYGWTGYSTETTKLTTKIRFVCTVKDSTLNFFRELEVIY